MKKESEVKTLLTYVGNNDQYPFDKPGAILSLLAKMKFDQLFLFLNNESYLTAASEINRFCKENYPALKVSYIDCPAINPTDYNLVYPAMYSGVTHILKDFPDDSYTISLTSGTPTMHACWIFLVQGGVIDAEVVQVDRSGDINPVSFNLDDFPQIVSIADTKAELTRIARENLQLKKALHTDEVPFIGESPVIQAIKKIIQRICDTDLSVLIRGQSGTGKEEIAKSLHLLSHRREEPMVTINCGAIPGQLFESELFGHLKGTFTGAVEDKEGQLAAASGGTVFLDEIGELALDQQVKLLRVLEYQKFMPLGSTEEHEIDVRFLFATNRDLREMVEEGDFREDLFYRLAQYEIELPPLSQRGKDKLLLARKFLDNQNKINGMQKKFDSSAVEKILEHPWPGNVRQLKNAIEVAFLMSADDISEHEIRIVDASKRTTEVSIPDEGIDLEYEIIPKYYQAALKKTNGNAAQAARLLGFEPHTFRARLKKSKDIYHEE